MQEGGETLHVALLLIISEDEQAASRALERSERLTSTGFLSGWLAPHTLWASVDWITNTVSRRSLLDGNRRLETQVVFAWKKKAAVRSLELDQKTD